MLSTSRKNAYSSVFFISAISFAQTVYVIFVLFSSYCLIFRSSQWLYTILTQPKVLANRIFCSSLGYILNLYALFATFSLPFSFLLPLAFYIFFYYFNWSSSRCDQTKTLAPEMFFPQFFSYLRKFLLQ